MTIVCFSKYRSKGKVLSNVQVGKFSQNIQNLENWKRMGKLLYEINDYSDTVGWDGNYNGHPMPSTDYWYLISLPELDKILRGHFTLFRFEYK